MRTARLALVVLLFLPALEAQERCGVAKDFMLRALERIRQSATNSDYQNSLALLKHSCELCPGLGDAWYFRSLFERKLGNTRLADYALSKAKLMDSEALRDGLDPFRIAAPPQPGEKFTAAARDKWALVIGIRQFRDSHIRELRYTASDAEAFAGVLKDPNAGRFKADHVKLLLDSAATTSGIRTELNKLARTAAPEDLVVIYIASHGTAREDDIGGVNYIVTHDTNVTDQDTLYGTALPMWELTSALRSRMQARKAAVFLDTCHSAGAFNSGPLVSLGEHNGLSVSTLAAAREGVGRVIVTSSQVGESSWESDKLRHGYFTWYLMQALHRDGGQDTIRQIFTYLQDEVPKQVLAEKKAPQTPVMSPSEMGAEVVVGVPASVQ